jgi:hypothetical protein
MRRPFAFFPAIAAAIALSTAASAQDTTLPDYVVASGLDNPRHITFIEDILAVAEAGTGGDQEVQGMFGPALLGPTGAISVIVDDTLQAAIGDLGSLNEGGEVTGVTGLSFFDDLLWYSGRDEVTNTYVIAFGEGGTIVHEIDTLAFETELNPDGDIVDSNPVDIAWDSASDTVYIADAGANTVWKTTDRAALEVFVTWPEGNPVPTSLAVTPEGTVYVGFLTGFPFPAGGSRVEHYLPDGTLAETFEGFTTIVDLLFANDTLYAVQFGEFGDMGWTPFTGAVVDVFSGEAYATGLNLPYGLAADAEGELYLVLSSAYSGDGAGVVVRGLDNAAAFTDRMMMGMPEPPVATPEVGS